MTGSWTSWLAGPLIFLSPLFTVWLVLFAVFLWVPNTRVSIRAAAIGTLVAACLAYLGMELFGLYVQNAAGATLLGALALVPLFLLWLYVLWLVVLFGLQVSYIIQTFKTANLAHEMSKQQESRFLDADWVLPVTERVAAAFRQGEITTAEQIEKALSLPLLGINRLLEALEKQKVLRTVERDKQIGYTLARPAEAIALTELLDLAQNLAPSGPAETRDSPVWRALDEARQAGRAVLGGRTLADLLDSGNA